MTLTYGSGSTGFDAGLCLAAGEDGKSGGSVRRLGWLAAALILLWGGSSRLLAQEPAPVNPPASLPPGLATAPPAKTGGLTPNPTLLMREFEPAANEEYQLGRGDEIAIDVLGRPEMNSKHVVGPDGKVTLPLIGSIVLADKTREQAAEAVEAAYKPFYSNLTVTVGVDKYTSNQVLLLGAVEHPGVQAFDRPPTLLEVISRGGAVVNSGKLANAPPNNAGSYNMQAQLLPTTLGIPERCAIYRGTDKVLWVDLKTMLDGGSPMADMRLKRDDIVYVPSPAERYVSVLGEVQHPGALQLDNSSTLPKLLALAGGITQLAGHYPDIQVIQPSTGKTRIISYKQLLQPNGLDLTLQSGDIIYVPQSGFNRAAYVLEKLSPLVTVFTATAFFAK
jgi:polysaccharide export outer membrane protein